MLTHIFSKKAPTDTPSPAKETFVAVKKAATTGASARRPSEVAYDDSKGVRQVHKAVILHLAGLSLELPQDEYNAQDASNVLNSLAHVFPHMDALAKKEAEAVLVSSVFDHMAEALMVIKPQEMGSQVT